MITYYQANLILNKAFGQTAWNPPATYYIGLSTNGPAADGTGVVEPSGGSYARVAVTNNKTNFTVASGSGTLSNATAVTFPESSGDWGTITHVFIADASSNGNILYYDQLSTSRAIPTSTTITFGIGAMVFSMTNS